jgi:hypothetical protein
MGQEAPPVLGKRVFSSCRRLAGDRYSSFTPGPTLAAARRYGRRRGNERVDQRKTVGAMIAPHDPHGCSAAVVGGQGCVHRPKVPRSWRGFVMDVGHARRGAGDLGPRGPTGGARVALEQWRGRSAAGRFSRRRRCRSDCRNRFGDRDQPSAAARGDSQSGSSRSIICLTACICLPLCRK